MTIPELYQVYLQYQSVQTDTRKLKQGDLFFALKGPSFNGNEFAKQALDAGAAYAIIDEKDFFVEGKTILVDDVLTALQDLSLHHRMQFDIPFIAITGSNGKTTTKELIHAVLSSTFKTSTTVGNLNNHIGVPLTLLSIPPGTEMAVVEMGANHQGEIASYCAYTRPTHGLITNCGKAHLEGFGGVEGVKKGKGELFAYLRSNNGIAFIMNDYEYLHDLSKGIDKIYSYGTENADVAGKALEGEQFLSVKFSKGFEGTIKTNLVGNYNLPNVLAAVAVGKYFGVKDELVKNSIEAYLPSNSRSQLLEKGNTKIILDAYNANPSSMKLAIENLAGMDASKKILVLGAMAELGNESLEEHKNIVDTIAKFNWTEVVLVGGDFLKIPHPFKAFSNAAEAGDYLKGKVDDAYLLVKGSRSMQMEKLLNYL